MGFVLCGYSVYVSVCIAQIEDVEDERRNADRVMVAMRENLVQPGGSAQSSSFQSESAGFTSSFFPLASSSVSHILCSFCSTDND